ncbi:hypothetical protein PCNPT3_06535 [Psychromonas sp. CNPT3]|uniref:YbaM family protein n=1 Tax=Psychromonas sp. CNPT3 TaxID=314282 RepID=UPI00006E4804|nr:YbaM family protein [Psychromonas sp. CNPT3]AGH81247.1 hypothetical protein PCNPT3_06535 [Psychromonas sp. CNPT3]
MNKNVNEAPESVKIAVDIIMLLEQNKVPTLTAVEALEIALNDFKKKQTAS